jgi:hypothetical protein
MNDFTIQPFPKTRIATLDVCTIGKQKHHIAALLEMDVSESRKKIKQYRQTMKHTISFTAWLLKVISNTLKTHEQAASYLKGKQKLIVLII